VAARRSAGGTILLAAAPALCHNEHIHVACSGSQQCAVF
jgi:hypothetical protein